MNKMLFLFFALLAGCSSVPTMNYSKSSGKVFNPKASNCDFFVRTTAPKEAFEEIGVINLSPAYYSNGIPVLPNNSDELKGYIREQVCKAGGDAVIGDVNGVGQYVRVTILKIN